MVNVNIVVIVISHHSHLPQMRERVFTKVFNKLPHLGWLSTKHEPEYYVFEVLKMRDGLLLWHSHKKLLK